MQEVAALIGAAYTLLPLHRLRVTSAILFSKVSRIFEV